MGTKLSGSALQKISTLEEARRKWDRVKSLLEKAAAPSKARDNFLHQCRRAAEEVGRLLQGSGLGALAGSAHELAQLVGRSANFDRRIGSARDLVGTLHGAIDRAERAIRKEAEEA